tara:strand:+ start:430 stop:639 length:210 start_codon:yes stop_codon:yes gene_type:complete
MPFHIKRPSTAISSVDVYWKDDNTWTDVYADRKQYSSKSTADAQKATTTTINGVTYTPSFWSTSTVVTE